MYLPKRLPLPRMLLIACLSLPCFSQAQLWTTNLTGSASSCYVNLSWGVADLGTGQGNLFISRSNDGGTTFNVIGSVAAPSGDLGNGNTWNGTFQDKDPYGDNTTVPSGGVEYQVFFTTGGSRFSNIFRSPGFHRL